MTHGDGGGVSKFASKSETGKLRLGDRALDCTTYGGSEFMYLPTGNWAFSAGGD